MSRVITRCLRWTFIEGERREGGKVGAVGGGEWRFLVDRFWDWVVGLEIMWIYVQQFVRVRMY